MTRSTESRTPACFLRAKGEFDLDLASCLLIGDKLSDCPISVRAKPRVLGQRFFWIHRTWKGTQTMAAITSRAPSATFDATSFRLHLQLS